MKFPVLFLSILFSSFIHIYAQQCPSEIVVMPSENCLTYHFELNGDAFGNVIWDFSDAGAEDSGIGIDHTYAAPGTFTVCANPVSMDCDPICVTVTVICPECELDVEMIQLTNDYAVFQAFNFPDNAQIHWTQNGQQVNIGNITTFLLQPGVNEICAAYETPECPQGVFWCETIYSENDCPTGLVAEEIECGVYEISLQGAIYDAQVFWNFGTESYMGNGEPQIVDFAPGTYTIYAIYSHPNYPQCSNQTYILDLTVEECDPTCPGEIVASDLGCGLWMFALYPGGSVTGGVWNFGDGTTSTAEGSSVTHQFENSGVYTIQVNSNLNQPCFNNFFSTTIEVDACEDDCPEGIEFNETTCGNFVFWIPGAISDANVFWNFGNGNVVEGGPEQLQSFDPGFYTIYAIYSHPNYPECSNQTYVIQLLVEDCDPELCPSQITYTAVNECGSFLFNLNNFGDFGNIIWTWGDGGSNSGANNVGHTYQEAGQYELCVQAWTGDCPDGVEICIPITVEDCDVDCPTGIDAVDLGCGLWGFEFGSSTSVLGGSWFISNGNSTVTINGGHYITYQFEESGIYQVGVNAMMAPGCFNNYALITILVEVCEDECPESLNIVQMACGYYYFMGWNEPGEEIVWSYTIGNESYSYTTVNDGFISQLFTTPGSYDICAMYYSEYCPDGAEICETINVPDCNPNDCNLTLTYSYLGDGLFNFVATGGGQGMEYFWDFGDDESMNGGYNVDHQFEPGVYTVCVSYESDICTFPVSACVTIEVPEVEEECVGYMINFTVEMNTTGFSTLAFSLTNENGIEFQGGTFFISEFDAFFQGVACLPSGCYTLDITNLDELGIDVSFVSIFNNLESLDDFINIVQISESEVQIQIDVNGDCDFSTGIGNDVLSNIQVYPVPATDVLNITIPAGEVVEATVFSASGQLIYTEQLTQSVQLNVADWTSGLYLLKLENNYTTLTHRIQKF